MTDPLRVGFVGLGDQGGPMAARVIDAGHPTTLWARRSASLEPYADTPAGVATSLPELGAASDVLCVCVVNDDDVLAVLEGDDGALTAMEPGGIVAVHSTVHPDLVRRLRDDHRDITFVDAPVSGGGEAAERGELLVIAGGDTRSVERCRPIFASYADPIVHIGELGTALEAKVLNNSLFTAILALVADTNALAEARGLDATAFATILAHGSAQSYAGDTLSSLGGDMAALGSAGGALLDKDVGILTDLLDGDDRLLVSVARSSLSRMGRG